MQKCCKANIALKQSCSLICNGRTQLRTLATSVEIDKSLLPHNTVFILLLPNPTLEGILGYRNDGTESKSLQRKIICLHHSDPCLPVSRTVSHTS